MGPCCYFGVLPQTTPPMMHLTTQTGHDLYTRLDQRQIPSDGSNLRRGIELKHIPRIFTLFLKLPARHKLNQVCTGRGFKLKAPTVIINSCHEKLRDRWPRSTSIPVLYIDIYLTENNTLQREMQEYGILTFSFLQGAIQLFSVPIHWTKEQQKLWWPRLSQLNGFW